MINNLGKYYLYRHVRLDNGDVFYVGIGTKKDKIRSSMKSEYDRAYCKHRENSIWLKITNKSDYKIEILVESDDYEFIKNKEVEFISLYGRINTNSGILSNMTDGGEGVKGRVPTEEWRRNQSNFMKNRPPLKGNLHPNFGKKQTAELVEKRIAPLRGRKKSKESCEKLSKTMRERGNNRGNKNPMFGKIGADSPRARAVIDVFTLDIYDCIKCIPSDYEFNYKLISSYLSGVNPNKSNIRYLDDFYKEIESLERMFCEKIDSKEKLLSLIQSRKDEYINFWEFYPGKKPPPKREVKSRK